MTTINSKAFYGEIVQYKNNPTQAHFKTLDILKNMFDGVEVDMDPCSPFIFALDCTAVNTAICLDEHAAIARRLNATAATTPDDLYTHMSDKDYFGRFALPASADFMVAIDITDLEGLLVSSVGVEAVVDRYKQVIIPRNTFFQVGGYTFSLEYPVSVRKYNNAGYSVVFINDKESPLTDMADNNIDHDIVVANNNIKYLRFTIPTKQFAIESRQDTVSHSSGRYYAFEFEDHFCLARVFIADAQGRWKEIKTTHSDQVFDPAVPTVLVRVEGKTIRFEIPYVYVNNSADGTFVRGKIRYDVYTTKGKIAVDLSAYNQEHFMVTWHAVDTSDWSPESVVLKEIKNIYVRSMALVDGGRFSLSFDELKERVMNNAMGRQNLPITNAQLNAELVDLGYQIKANIDVVTNRIFQACKETPNPTDPMLITPACVSMQTLGTSMLQVVGSPGVFDHGNAVTLSSKTLYKSNNGVISVVSKHEHDEIFAYTDSPSRARVVNERNYYYSPYYYVLDASAVTFEVRPYHLDSPRIVTKSFEVENATSQFKASLTQAHSVGVYHDQVNRDQGYVIRVKTKSNANFKDIERLPHEDISVQLSFKPTNGNGQRVYLSADLVAFDPVDNERTYQFKLSTKFNVNVDNEIEFLNFTNNVSDTPVRCNLRTTFDVFIQVAPSSPRNYQSSRIDEHANPSVFKNRSTESLTWERLDIEFGQPLKNLWCQSRSNVASVVYKTFASDVLAYYDHDVYETDTKTGRLLTFDQNGKLNKKKLFSRGDLVRDIDGKEVVLHHKGDIVYDNAGQPIKVDNYQQHLIRYVDLLLIEGVYYFVTDEIASKYRDYIRNLQVTWITKELPRFEQFLLEQTKIYFHPKVSSGIIPVLTSNNTQENIDSAQSLKVILHVPPTTYRDVNLKQSLTRLCVSVIDNEFKKPRVCVSDIEKALKVAFNEDVYNIELSGVTGFSKYAMITVMDVASRLGIRKRLVAAPDGVLTVEEDVSITFVQHGTIA